MTFTEGIFNDAITSKIKSLTAPYELYVSPYTGNIYFTDAQSYASAGDLYGYTAGGQQLFGPLEVYVNPAHLLALKPETVTGIARPANVAAGDGIAYNLAGQRVGKSYKGVVTVNGRKMIRR